MSIPIMIQMNMQGIDMSGRGTDGPSERHSQDCLKGPVYPERLPDRVNEVSGRPLDERIEK